MTDILSPGRHACLIPDAARRPADDPIFALDAEARRRAQAGESVVNATLGALMDDDGALSVMPCVAEAFRRVDPRRAAAYAPIAGSEPFRRAVLEDVLGAGAPSERAVAVATAGGTGAIHHAVQNFLEPGQALLTTSFFWTPYAIIAQHAGRALETFEMFDGAGAFDLAGMERALRAQVERQGRALVVLNFPCHNPTGYSLDAREWRGVAELLARAGERAPVAVLIDLAYARYGAAGSEAWLAALSPALRSVTLLVAWSASKAFAQYGSRVGALVAVPPTAEEAPAVLAALTYSCRGTWSNCNHLGLLAITELLLDGELARRADAERGRLVALLDERVAAFNREARAAGLRFPRYEGGFFVTVFTPDAERSSARAREEGVFVVPMRGGVRVALCSTPAREVPRVCATLARATR